MSFTPSTVHARIDGSDKTICGRDAYGRRVALTYREQLPHLPGGVTCATCWRVARAEALRAPPRVHWLSSDDALITPCGRRPPKVEVTRDLAAVTCIQCTESAWRRDR